ncbi:MAG TPA: hypothetical protein VE088_09130, partial [Gaiellaceae bacterium]|nr:hypothetical protein [Gaiellaceae bacterium]
HGNQPLVEHWDGTRWSVAPSPAATASREELDGVVALSADDVWAAGADESGPKTQPFVEHWDGSSWNVTPTAETQSDDSLAALAAGGSGNVWAVGTRLQP